MPLMLVTPSCTEVNVGKYKLNTRKSERLVKVASSVATTYHL